MIKGESSIDNTPGIYDDRVQALFDRMFSGIQKRVTVAQNVKWFDSEVKQHKIKCGIYEKKWLKTKKDKRQGNLQPC